MSATLRLDLDAPDSIDLTLACLRAGGLAAIATETVYGLAADAADGAAVARIFEAKGRPRFNPLIAHVATLTQARTFARFDPVAVRLAERFWPGPLTMVLPKADDAPIHPIALGGLPTIALRAPQGAMAEVLARFHGALVAPSANRSGRVSPTTADHVLRTLDGRIDLVLDGGPAAHGLESTIVRVEADALVLLRPGTVTEAELRDATGLPLRRRAPGEAIDAPGQLLSHYAPHGRVRLDAEAPRPGEYWIGFGEGGRAPPAAASGAIDLSPGGDLREAAAALFAALSLFDAPNIDRIAVASIPETGLGEAINDRLRRAAADR